MSEPHYSKKEISDRFEVRLDEIIELLREINGNILVIRDERIRRGE